MAKRPKSPRSIPSAEDFARASANAEAQSQLFATIRESIRELFAGAAPLHDVFLFPGPETDYEAYIFYRKNADIEASRANGIEQELKDAILREFISLAPSERGEPTVAFKFDSYENVEKKCNGSYGIYLK